MKNKNYVYFFLSMCACTVHGNSLLSAYDNTENAYNDSFEDVVSVKRSSISKKIKNSQKPKGTPDLMPDSIVLTQDMFETRIKAQLKHVFNDDKIHQLIAVLARPIVESASRRVKGAIRNDAYDAQMNAQSKVDSTHSDSQSSAMKKDVTLEDGKMQQDVLKVEKTLQEEKPKREAKKIETDLLDLQGLEKTEKSKQNADWGRVGGDVPNKFFNAIPLNLPHNSEVKPEGAQIRYPDLPSYVSPTHNSKVDYPSLSSYVPSTYDEPYWSSGSDV